MRRVWSGNSLPRPRLPSTSTYRRWSPNLLTITPVRRWKLADIEATALTHAEGLQHHFDDPEQQLESATLGMWVFLLTEIMFFGGMFAGYTVYRNLYPDAFASTSHFMNVTIGAINTGVLICSSFTMVLAVRSAQLGQKKALILFLVLTLVLGFVFLV